jgi:hypothetical protein
MGLLALCVNASMPRGTGDDAKLLAVAVGTFFAIVALLVIRFEMLARKAQERTGAGNVAVDVYLLVHSTWLILSFVAVLVLALWISYRWIFKTHEHVKDAHECRIKKWIWWLRYWDPFGRSFSFCGSSIKHSSRGAGCLVTTDRERGTTGRYPGQSLLLVLTGEIVEERWLKTAVHPFDYAVVRILNGNICFGFTRGQEQLNVTLSPRHAPRDTHELHIVIAAIDSPT